MILPSGLSTRNYSILGNSKGWGRGWTSCDASRSAAVITLARSGVRLQVHARVAVLFKTLLDEVERRGYLLRVGQCWGGACRQIAGTSTPSNHSWWLAVDINAPANPYTSSGQHDIPEWVFGLFRAYGFGVGADYTGKQDWMHVEFMGDPDDADAMTALALRSFGTNHSAPAAPVVIQEDTMLTLDDGLTVFLIGGDGTIYQDSYTAAGWSGFIDRDIPGKFAKSLTGAVDSSGVYRLYAVGTDGGVYQVSYQPGEGAWRGPFPLGGKSI